jgi:Transmembrane secretion effector
MSASRDVRLPSPGGSRGPEYRARSGAIGGNGRAEPEPFADSPRRVVPSAALYFAGQVASASGTFLQTTAIGWLVLQLTGSASALGLVLAAGGLPSLLLGPWGGSIIDRVDLRKLLIGTQTVFGLLAAGLWIVAATGHGRGAGGDDQRDRRVRADFRLACPAGVCQHAGRARRSDQRGQPERRGDEQRPGGWPGDRRCADRHRRDDAVLRRERPLLRRRGGRAGADPAGRGCPPREPRARPTVSARGCGTPAAGSSSGCH